MEQANSLSLINRFDGSYFYLIELGLSHGLFKYMLANWEGNHLGKPIIIYSHTKRSRLSEIEKQYFDNNLLAKRRLEKYINKNNNLYIGGIERVNGIPNRIYKQGINLPVNYKVYLRDDNYILIEELSNGELNSYSINEFVNKITAIDYESSIVHTEKDLLNMNNSEKNYVVNHLLSRERVKKKLHTSNGYVGTIAEINGKYRKIENKGNLEKTKKIS